VSRFQEVLPCHAGLIEIVGFGGNVIATVAVVLPVAVIPVIVPVAGADDPPLDSATTVVLSVIVYMYVTFPTPKFPVLPVVVLTVIIEPVDKEETTAGDKLYILKAHVAVVTRKRLLVYVPCKLGLTATVLLIAVDVVNLVAAVPELTFGRVEAPYVSDGTLTL
jgi:hypothetical protein